MKRSVSLQAIAALLFAVALCAGPPAAGEVRAASGVLTITTEGTGNEAHLITFPDSTTLSIDCGEGDIVTKSHFHSDHCASCSNQGQYHRNNVVPGQILYQEDGVTVEVVAANGRVVGEDATYVSCPASDENKVSMALLVTYGGFDYLTAGDLTATPERTLGNALAAQGVGVDVLKVSHHGSSSSSPLSFLQAIAPEYAVVCGNATKPYTSTLANLTSAGVNRLYDTYATRNVSAYASYPIYFNTGGTITISTDGCTYTVAGGSPAFTHGPYQVDEPGSCVPSAPTPTPGPVPPSAKLVRVSTNASSVAPGGRLQVDVAVRQIMFPPFDAYAVILGPAGVHSIMFGNSIVPGVRPVARGVRFLPVDYYKTLLDMNVPAAPRGRYQVIIGLTEMGARVTGVGDTFGWDAAYFSVE